MGLAYAKDACESLRDKVGVMDLRWRIAIHEASHAVAASLLGLFPSSSIDELHDLPHLDQKECQRRTQRQGEQK